MPSFPARAPAGCFKVSSKKIALAEIQISGKMDEKTHPAFHKMRAEAAPKREERDLKHFVFFLFLDAPAGGC